MNTEPGSTPSRSTRVAALPFNVMTKPIGPICNLDCKYCFYLEKESLYAGERKWAMSDEVLESYITQYIAAQPASAQTITFAWQGGEPTLLGVDYFRRVVGLQQKHSDGRPIANALQTNGTLLDDDWGTFFAKNQFLVGISIDGPRELHDTYRVDKKQQSTFDAVMRGIDVLKRHHVDFNTLTVVSRANSREPRSVYRFLKEIGSGFIQFIPLVERVAQTRLTVMGLDLAEPMLPEDPERPPVTEWSVLAEDYGQFLVEIFDQWVRGDVGKTFVQMFDVALGNWAGAGPGLCVFAEKCGTALAVEHNGDLYSCDHYVYPRYRLGNLLNASLADLVDSPQQRAFGDAKSDTLPDYCRRCEVRFACNGECPKHRFIRTPSGEDGLNYLCAAYRRFFNYVDPYMRTMTDLLRSGRAPAEIMSFVAQRDRQISALPLSGNDPCPCRSGLKFRKCHGVKRGRA